MTTPSTPPGDWEVNVQAVIDDVLAEQRRSSPERYGGLEYALTAFTPLLARLREREAHEAQQRERNFESVVRLDAERAAAEAQVQELERERDDLHAAFPIYDSLARAEARVAKWKSEANRLAAEKMDAEARVAELEREKEAMIYRSDAEEVGWRRPPLAHEEEK